MLEPPPTETKASKLALSGELDGGLERLVGRLDLDLVEQYGVDALGSERVEHNGDRLKLRQTAVGDIGDALGSESGDLVPDLTGDARSELDGGGVYGEGCFELVVGHWELHSYCADSTSRTPASRENLRSKVNTADAPLRRAAARIIRSAKSARPPSAKPC